MARFRYAALTTAGRTRRGLLEAESREDALRALAARGETAVELALARPGGLVGLFGGGGTSIARDELAAFLADLAALNDAGVPLRQGLDVLSGEASGPRAARLARLIAERLDAGSDFGRAARVEDQGDLALAAELVRAGEASGRLSDALRFAAELLRRQSEFARRVASALAYPAFLMILSIAALIALAAFAGPAIAPLLEETPEGSPALAAVLAAGEALRRHGLVILAGLALIVVVLTTAARRDPLRAILAQARARAPLLGTVVRDLNCGAFARALGAMLSGGAPAGTAFDLAAATAPNSAWRARFLRAGETLRDGRTVAAALAALEGAAPELARLARVGEETGALGEMLNRAGDLAVERGLRRLDRVAGAAGPILILIMGGFTGWLMSAFLGGLTQLGEGVL